MAELMLVNPRKRRKARKTHAAKPRRKTRARRARNPVASRRAVHHAAPRRHRRRRNPVGGSHNIGGQLKNAFAGALGGVVVDFAAGFIVPKLPASMQGGYMGKVVKVGLAVGLGMLAQKTKLVKGPMAARMVEGAMTVELYDLTRNVIQTAMPNVRLAGDDDYIGEFIPVNGATANKLLAGEDAFAGDGDDLGEYLPVGGLEDDFAGYDPVYPNPYDI